MAEPGRRTLLLRVALVAAGLAVLVLGGRQLAGLIPAFVARVTALGPLAPVVFMLAYAAAVVAFIPGSLLTLAAGAAFGLGRGVVVVLLGATLGGSLAFLIARYVARARVARAVAANPRFAAIDRAIGRDGRRIVFLLRLSPVFPFNLLNYGLGLTTASLEHGSNEEQMTEAVHVAAAIRGGASLVHGVQMRNHLHQLGMQP